MAPPQQLVLFSRLGRFDVAELDRLIWEERRLFEWNAFIWPIEDLPLVRARMRHRRATANAWVREFLQANARFRRYVLRELDRNGPMLSRDLKADLLPEWDTHRWWGTRQVRLMLELLQLHGEIAVAGRAGKQRLWDLAGRVYPASESIPWRHAERLIREQRRRALGVWLERGKLHVHPEISDEPVPRPGDLPLTLRPARARPGARRGTVRLLLPARDVRAEGEAAVRLLRAPILYGDRIVGRIDVERDRPSSTLRMNGVWWEEGVRPIRLEPALRRLNAFVAREPRT